MGKALEMNAGMDRKPIDRMARSVLTMRFGTVYPALARFLADGIEAGIAL